MHRRWLLALFSVSALAALMISCGGKSEDQATTFCDQLRTADAACVTDKAYAQCIDCYESCGDSCRPLGKCPEAFGCN